jgi:dTDP-4-amino-4,6-dideoxy-D-galactose acyltransferase
MRPPLLQPFASQVPELYLPYPFLKQISIETRRALWSHSVFLAGEDTIDVQMTQGFALGRILSWDSAFFNKKIFRIEAIKAENVDQALTLIKLLEEKMKTLNVDYAFSLVPAEHTAALEGLQRHGWSLIETRLTYSRSELDSFHAPKRFAVRQATLADSAALGTVAAESVNVFDRFHADPFFGREHADALMRQWVHASITEGFADSVLMPVSGPKAFMTLKYHRALWASLGEKVSQLVFSAVSRDAPGWYPRLVSEALLDLQSQGVTTAFLTTQAENAPVLRVWQHYGFTPAQTTLVLRKVIAHDSP